MFFVAAVLAGGLAQAQNKTPQQQEDTTVKQLNEVVISATRTEKKVRETPRSVTVFTAADIQKLAYQNLGDLLSRSEGIYIPGVLQTPGSIQTVGLRGASSNQTLIMIDGIKISDATSPDNVLDFSEISLANIERIEIVRGSHSTLYGSSAIGGVINIITKQNGKQGLNGTISSQMGTFGKKTSDLTNQFFLNYTDKSGVYANAEVLDTRVQGLNAVVDTNSKQSIRLNEQDDFFKTDIVGKLGFKNTKTDAYISYRNAFQQSDIDDGAYIDDDNRIIRIKRDLITYGTQYNFNNNTFLKFIGGYSNMFRRDRDDSTFRGGVSDYTFTSGRYSGRNWNNELQYSWKNKSWDITSGIGIAKEQMTLQTFFSYNSPFFGFESNSKIDSVNTHTKFAYAHTDWKQQLGSSILTIGAGARLNDHSRFGNYVTFEITPSLFISEKILIYSAFTSGYNAPSLYQLYSPNKDFASGVTRGNEDLKPEKSLSTELGVKLSPAKSFFLTLSGFHTRVKNAIEYVYLWNGSTPVNSLSYTDAYGDTYLNIGTNKVLGAELSFNVILSRQFTFSGNGSLLKGNLEYSPSSVDSIKTKSNHVQLYSNGSFLTTDVNVKKLVRRPSTANLSLSYKPINQLRITADYRFVGGRQDVFYDDTLGPYGALGKNGLDNYSLLNLSFNWQAHKQVLLQCQLNNLLNEDYMEVSGYNTRKRGIVIGARFAF